ncbi:CYIR protein [Plasmodium cynomolgi strain B]|uniref:CYIR protein n=1 Tax=Plasmodium cynomolgi (strain B) TaxID=1120755 RepID=K6V051_PLACD|nr:CYIR protein [Plasmodium cynomolgi strain B]GAB69654.1 CYIR protein [Plasmodium cynomolgi strain B]
MTNDVQREETGTSIKIDMKENDKLNLLKEKCPSTCLDLLLTPENRNVRSLEENNYIRYIPRSVWLDDTTKKINKLHLQETTIWNEPLKKIFDKFKDISNLIKFYTHLDLCVYTCDNPDNASRESNENNTSKHTCKVKLINEIADCIGQICNCYDIKYDKCSDYLLYWLYGVIEESNFTLFQIHDVFNEMGILKENTKCFNDNNKKCINKLDKVFNTRVLRNKKLLHDFTEYYEDIKNIMNKEEQTNKEIYCKFVKLYFELYKRMKDESLLDLTKYYQEEIKNFQEKFNNDSLSFLEGMCPQNGIKSLFEAENVTTGLLKQLPKEVIEPIMEPLENEKEIKVNSKIFFK